MIGGVGHMYAYLASAQVFIRMGDTASFSTENCKMADKWLISMENRLTELENEVFGAADKEINYPKVNWNINAVQIQQSVKAW